MARIRALRGFFLNGDTVPAGAVIDVPALQAGDIVATKRGEFVDDTDRQQAVDAVTAERERAFKTDRNHGPSWVKSY